ncbi:MAG: VacJ family lipoprotein [Magnetococcales bacterium]|nr:VacJ family lipoprotein [Magnetococcales bacterium]
MRKLLAILMTWAFLWLPGWSAAASDPGRHETPGARMAAVDGGAGIKDLPRADLVEESDGPVVSDPLEPWNRIVFTLNDLFYHGLLKPVTELYAFILPEPVRIAFGNFFHNLAMPKHFLSALLQGKMEAAGVELTRFGINTILGGLGFFDVAETHFNLKSSDEDLGQTLATLGMDDAIYIQWPILGPSTLRDSFGLVADAALNPLSYVPENPWTRAEIYGGKVVNQTSMRLGEYEDLKKAAIDPYIALRDAYLQMRRDQVQH